VAEARRDLFPAHPRRRVDRRVDGGIAVVDPVDAEHDVAAR